MTRVSNWPAVLAEQIELHRNKPFVWGKNDCGLWAADVVLALTGRDFGVELRGRYKTARGAQRRVNAAGGMRALAAGLPEKPVNLAQRGDVVLAMSEGRETFGIVVGGGHWCAPGPAGLVFRGMDEVLTVLEV